MDRVFVDSDSMLDLLDEKHPYSEDAGRLFSRADQKRLKLMVSSLSFSNIHYVLRKRYAGDESRKLLSRFKVLVQVLAVDDKIIELALSSSFGDFEDAIQYYTAIENKASVIITRNLKDYKFSSIPVMTAESYMKV